MRESGFTIAETLITLAITSILFLITAPVWQIDTSDYHLNLFTKEFLTEIEHAQNYAVVTGHSTKVESRTQMGEIRFIDEQNGQNNIRDVLYLPKGVSQNDFKTFWVKSDSGYIEPLTITFSSKKTTIKITIQMGMGRYRVEEIKN